MKQHITVEQLNELSEKGKERLRKWWKPQDGDMVLFEGSRKGAVLYDDGEYIEYDPVKKIACGHSGLLSGKTFHTIMILPSIGQMIEFLDEHKKHDIRINHQTTLEGLRWEFAYGNPYTYGGNFVELIDALWEAVKEVLEK